MSPAPTIAVKADPKPYTTLVGKLKLLLSKASTNGVNLYDYGDGTPNIASKKQKQNSSGADSIPIKNKPLVIPKVIIPAPKITIHGTPPPPPVKVENPVVNTTKKPTILSK